MAPTPAFATPAPTSPPISACELLEGMPAIQVTMFQTMAPTRAAKITAGVDDAGVDDALAHCLGDMKTEE